ncbi:unnamed protein product, partial [Urochloa humidicola]
AHPVVFIPRPSVGGEAAAPVGDLRRSEIRLEGGEAAASGDPKVRLEGSEAAASGDLQVRPAGGKAAA